MEALNFLQNVIVWETNTTMFCVGHLVKETKDRSVNLWIFVQPVRMQSIGLVMCFFEGSEGRNVFNQDCMYCSSHENIVFPKEFRIPLDGHSESMICSLIQSDGFYYVCRRRACKVCRWLDNQIETIKNISLLIMCRSSCKMLVIIICC